MKIVDQAKALFIIESMIRRRLKAQGKDVDEAWIKSKALDIYDESKANGDYIKQLEENTELQWPTF